jgi:heme/copper-type cytochrome/quinol oxidase subunit 3
MMPLYVTSTGVPFRPRVPAVSSVVLATLIFVITEVMFFCALISAYTVIKSHVFGAWSPPGDLRLPVAATALNTAILMISGVLMFLAVRVFSRDGDAGRAKARALLGQALLFGAVFVAFQGYEWVKLIRYGLSMTSGIFGATFFLLIGSHGLHALAAVVVMALVYRRLIRGELTVQGLRAMSVFWLFVVGIWPVLYSMVYLG